METQLGLEKQTGTTQFISYLNSTKYLQGYFSIYPAKIRFRWHYSTLLDVEKAKQDSTSIWRHLKQNQKKAMANYFFVVTKDIYIKSHLNVSFGTGDKIYKCTKLFQFNSMQ